MRKLNMTAVSLAALMAMTNAAGPNIDASHYSQNRFVSKTVFQAARDGDLENIKRKGIPPINEVNQNGETLLNLAVGSGNLELVKYLVQLFPDGPYHERKEMFKTDCFGRYAINIALKKGYLEIVKFLLENGFRVNMTDETGTSGSHDAATSGNLDLVKFLVNQKRFDVLDTVPPGKLLAGYTVLHAAASSGNLDLVKYLVQLGADPKAVDRYGIPVWESAASFEVFDYLATLQGVSVSKEERGWMESKFGPHVTDEDIKAVNMKFYEKRNPR